MELKDKVAVVTGGAGGIGRATCEALAEKDIKAVGVVDLSETVKDYCLEINHRVGREIAIPYAGDVTDAEFRRSVFADLKRRFEVVQLCVPAAGITKDRLAVKLDRQTHVADVYPLQDFETVININLISPIYWAMETVASVAEYRSSLGLGRWEPSEPAQGGVVFIGSVSSAGNRGQISYATAKSGLEGAQATLAKEAVFYGLRCNIIHPGFTDTPMVRILGEDFIEQHVLPNTQLRRLLHPDEVADAICFMLSNTAVSGSLWVDAGWHPAA